MKKWLFISTMVISALTLRADEPTSEETSTWVIGSQWIQEIREEYQNGSYSQFLEDLDREYQKGMTEGRFDANLQAWEQAAKDWKNSESSKFRQVSTEMHETLAKLDERTNKRLQSATKDHPDLLVAKIVRERVSMFSEPVDDLQEFLWGDDPMAVRIWQEMMKHMLKNSLLPQRMMEQGMSQDQMKKYMLALTLERIEKVKGILKEFPDHPMSSALSDSYDIEIVRNRTLHDEEYLSELANKTIIPENQVEERVSSIMADYLKKKYETMTKFIEQVQ